MNERSGRIVILEDVHRTSCRNGVHRFVRCANNQDRSIFIHRAGTAERIAEYLRICGDGLRDHLPVRAEAYTSRIPSVTDPCTVSRGRVAARRGRLSNPRILRTN
jgi:hypothetical protein